MFGSRAHLENATRGAGARNGQPPVEPVPYPRRGGATKHMPLPCGMLSSPVEGDPGGALAVAANAVRVSTWAASSGETHACFEHRAAVRWIQTAATEGSLQLLAGLAHPDYPIEDLVRTVER